MSSFDPAQEHSAAPVRRIWGMPRNVFSLGIVSFFTDISSDMIFGPLFPLFLKDVLKAPVTIIGLITGLTEGFESLLKISSGWLSDRIGKRKILAVLGYSLSTLAKPFLYWADVWGQALGVRFADRVGKGLRTSPRDALVADSAPEGERGKSFGFHRAMDTAGAAIGLAVAAVVVFLIQRGSLGLEEGTYQRIVLIGVVPAVLAVLVLLFLVRESRGGNSPGNASQVEPEGRSESKKAFSTKFKVFLVIMVLFTLGNSSDAFLSLRAQDLGYSCVQVVLMFVALTVVYALSSLPAGILSDSLGRKGMIMVGWVVYALVYLGFASISPDSAQWQIWTLFGVYGLYHGLTDGVARSFVADMVPSERRGTAYGLYHGAVGISVLGASLIAGVLWEVVDPAAPFFFGAALAGAAAVALMALVR